MVLEAKFGNQVIDNPGKRQLVCVVRYNYAFSFTADATMATTICLGIALHGLDKINYSI